MSYSEIYFAIASVGTIAIVGLLVLSLFYVLSILWDIKRLSKIARKEAEIIARGFEKGAGILGVNLSNEAAGFVRTVFALLLSHFAVPTSIRRRKTARIKSI